MCCFVFIEFLLNYEIGSSKGSELHDELVVCGYILSTSSLLQVGLVPQEATFGVSSVDSYSAHPLVNLEKNLFHVIGGTVHKGFPGHRICRKGYPDPCSLGWGFSSHLGLFYGFRSGGVRDAQTRANISILDPGVVKMCKETNTSH